MAKAIPKALLEQVGLIKLMKRLPDVYSRSIFSSFVASVRPDLPSSRRAGTDAIGTAIHLPVRSARFVGRLLLLYFELEERLRRCSTPKGIDRRSW